MVLDSNLGCHEAFHEGRPHFFLEFSLSCTKPASNVSCDPVDVCIIRKLLTDSPAGYIRLTAKCAPLFEAEVWLFSAT